MIATAARLSLTICLGLASLAASPLWAETRLGLRTGEAGDDLRNTLRAALLTNELLREGSDDPQDLVAAAQADYRRLLTALYNEGYFGPEVSITLDGREAAGVPPLGAPRTIDTIIVRVDPGRRFKFGQASLAPLPEGAPPPEDFRTGKTAGTDRMRAATRHGVEAWRALGHAKADLAAQSVRARHAEARLDATLRLDPGPRLTFGRLRISGNRDVRTERIRAIAGLPAGQVFDPDEVTRAATRLRRSGAFSSVAISEAEQIGPDQTLDIAAQVVEEAPRRFGFGAEMSTEEGGTLSGFWLHRNLLGGAERLRIEGRVTGIDNDVDGLDYRLQTRLGRPATFGPDTDLYALAIIESLQEPAFDSAQGQVEIGLRRIVSDRLEITAGLGLRHASVEDVFGSRDFTHFILPVAATWDDRDDPLDPTSGLYLNATALPFAGLDSTASGLRLTADARAYAGFGPEDRFVLAGRLQMGSVIGPELSDTMPDDLFYSGGGGTVRGQDYESLGVILPGRRFAGGRSFVGLSAELRARVSGPFSVVGFYDTGYVGRDSLPDTDSARHAGAGLGLRYDTGIGPIRLDLATPTTGADAGEDLYFYVGIGQAF
ncbi:MAG: autotransporter assembly complex protein TamA [Paracoccaceae bacterium]